MKERTIYDIDPCIVLKTNGIDKQYMKKLLKENRVEIFSVDDYIHGVLDMYPDVMKDIGIDQNDNIKKQIMDYCKHQKKGNTDFGVCQGIPYVIEFIL